MTNLDLTKIFEIKTNAAAAVFQEILDSNNPTKQIEQYFEHNPKAAFKDLLRLRKSNVSEHQELLFQFLETEGSFKTLQEFDHSQTGLFMIFFELFKNHTDLDQRAKILSNDEALNVLHKARYNKNNFKEAFKDLGEDTIRSIIDNALNIGTMVQVLGYRNKETWADDVVKATNAPATDAGNKPENV